FGGTALVPPLHDTLASLCRRAQHESAIVVVNTVYDFRYERDNPSRCWRLGGDEDAYPWIDVLIMDREEALKLSGAKNIERALAYFKAQGTSASIITDGARDIHFYSDGRLFAPREASLAVSAEVTKVLQSPDKPQGDTTGCGDNFVGGVLASLALQSKAGCKRGSFDIIQTCEMAIVSGGFACFYLGGTYLERYPGEKREKVMHLLDLYHTQHQG
ncbi:MAG TPA: PfkB family carbohydrate kinase, partial [Rectinema sp.]|nr:PfkB family carbohydrate kinase [Rectinema sp.]